MKMLFAILLAALLATGCGGRGAAPEGRLELTASANQTVYAADQPVTVTVRVKNNSASPVHFVMFDGCDNGIRVTLEVQGENAWFQPASRIGPDGTTVACTMALRMAELPPGAEISDEFTWDRTLGGAPAAPGTYTLKVTFSQGSGFEVTEPVTTELSISLAGG